MIRGAFEGDDLLGGILGVVADGVDNDAPAKGTVVACRAGLVGAGDLKEEALGVVAKKAIERRTGARGLRSIMESILLDTMFELPGLDGVEQVVIGPEVVEGKARPLYIYAERAERAS